MSRFCLLSGTTMDSKWVAWRTAFLAAFILSMMVNMNYGASLVSSLLSTPVKTIRTTRDLIDSSLQFAAEDISYSFPYFAVSNNDVLFAHFNQLISCHQIRSEMRSMNLFPTSDPSYFRPRNISSTWDLSSKKVSLQSSAMISSGSKLLFLLTTHTGRFIVFSVITNIYNKKTKGPTLMELFKSTGKQKSFFWQLEMFDVCTTGDTAHIETIFKFLPHTRQHGYFLLAQTPSFSKLFIPRTNGLVLGGSFAYFARNARCTVTTDLLVWYSNTLNDFSPGAAIFPLHTLASPSGKNVNCDEKQLTGKKFFELFLLSVQVS